MTDTFPQPQRARRGANGESVQPPGDDRDPSGSTAERFFSIENLLNRRAPPPQVRESALAIGPRRPQAAAEARS